MYHLLPLKIDVANTIIRIEEIETKVELFKYSRMLRAYQDSGLILVPVEVKDKLSEQLMRIYQKL